MTPLSAARAVSTHMAAAVYHGPGQLRVEQRPVPTPGAGQLLVKVDRCGVCGSDLHMVVEGWGRPGSIEGHEYAGVVAAVGAGVDGWAVGDRVVGGPSPGCGRCDHCRGARPSLCDRRDGPEGEQWQGAFAGYTVISADQAVAVPAELSLRAAALAEPLAVALHGITRSGCTAGQRALVMGAGPIGALTVAALRAGGTTEVTVCEPAPLRRDLARRLGATRVVTPDDLEVPSRAEPGRIVDTTVDVVLECSGKAEAMTAGLAQLRRGGIMVLVGAGMDAPRFDPNRILLGELVVTGAFLYDAGGFGRALDLLATGAIPYDALLEPADVPLGGLLEAMEALASGRLAGKVLVDPTIEESQGAPP